MEHAYNDPAFLAAEIKRLEQELRAAKLATFASQQELQTLKNEISRSVSMEYEDYQATKEDACTEDGFAAYQGSLNRIFRTLKRHGIDLE